MRCWASGRMFGLMADPSGVVPAQGAYASTSKNTAPVSFTARSTSESGSTGTGASVPRPCRRAAYTPYSVRPKVTARNTLICSRVTLAMGQ